MLHDTPQPHTVFLDPNVQKDIVSYQPAEFTELRFLGDLVVRRICMRPATAEVYTPEEIEDMEKGEKK